MPRHRCLYSQTCISVESRPVACHNVCCIFSPAHEAHFDVRQHSLALIPEDTFHMYWEFDDESITFEVQVKTRGWVGFGISSTGGMTNADVFIGWVKDGAAFFHVS